MRSSRRTRTAPPRRREGSRPALIHRYTVRRERDRKAAISSGRRVFLRGRSISELELFIDRRLQDPEGPGPHLDAFQGAFPEPAVDGGPGHPEKFCDHPWSKEAIMRHTVDITLIGRNIKNIRQYSETISKKWGRVMTERQFWLGAIAAFLARGALSEN